MDECVRIFRERNAPSIAAQPGFDHGHWWVDRATSGTFWTNEADERASRAHIAGLVERMANRRGRPGDRRGGARPVPAQLVGVVHQHGGTAQRRALVIKVR